MTSIGPNSLPPSSPPARAKLCRFELVNSGIPLLSGEEGFSHEGNEGEVPTFVSYIQYCGKIRGGYYSHLQVWIMIVTDLCDICTQKW